MDLKRCLAVVVFPLMMLVPATASATGPSGHEEGPGFPLVFFFLVVMLLFARVGAMAERLKQPAVLGELLMGVALGALAFLPWLGGIDGLRRNEFIAWIAEIGVVLLLFRVGLETNLAEMRMVGLRAALVALVGVVLPFGAGYAVSLAVLPDASFNTHLFIGATLTATSVGITARTFKDLGVLRSREAKIVLGAAVIDDVLGLLILAVTIGMVRHGTMSAASIGIMGGKAFAFLAGSIVIGILLAPRLGRLLSKIHPGVGMKMALALLFCGAFSYGAAALAGLAPIVGAFAAGLILEPVHFAAFASPPMAARLRAWAGKLAPSPDVAAEMKAAADHEDDAHVENLIEGVSSFFIPVFFVYTGLQVNLSVFADPGVVGTALALSVVAFGGKIAAGWASGKGTDHALVGFGMVPRGEVGLIFANEGRKLGVVDDRVFAVAVIVVIVSTLVTPPVLGALVRRRKTAP
jgi:Kef-type K+ transport system membrane component KefB